MPIYQSFNSKIKAWVKYHFVRDGIKIIDVKQRLPKVPFKHIPKKGKSKSHSCLAGMEYKTKGRNK